MALYKCDNTQNYLKYKKLYDNIIPRASLVSCSKQTITLNVNIGDIIFMPVGASKQNGYPISGLTYLLDVEAQAYYFYRCTSTTVKFYNVWFYALIKIK